MGKPRNCKCCDFNVPSGFVCIHCDDSGDTVCTESLTEAQCSGVSGIYRLGSCDITSSFCGKCDTNFESSLCESFFLSKNGPVKGDSNVFASGSYFPEKPLDLERIPTFTSHFKRGHHLRDYKGTGTHGWLSGIVPVGPIDTRGVNARLEFVNNQFPYIQNDSLVDIDYIGLCDKRQDPKYGCATIKFKNTVAGSTTTKLDKFHLKMGTFLRYGDLATLFSSLSANGSGVSPKYVGPFEAGSTHDFDHIRKFKSVCKDPSDPRVNSYLQGIVGNNNSYLQTAFDDRTADCYGDLPLACCSKHTKSMSAIYEFDISEFPIDTCFTLYNVAQIKTSSSSYGYFELTGETYVKPTTSFGNGSFFEYSVPVDNYCESSDTFFSDNLPGCRFGVPGFDCDPPPPPPPPVTTTTTRDPCPPGEKGVFHCRYSYVDSGTFDNPFNKWVRKSFFNSPPKGCECDCPSITQINNDWRAANGGAEPQIGQCADAYVPCCKPNLPSSCFDYTITFNPECGTTTTTTEGPTTTTTTTDPPEEPFFVTVCFDPLPCTDCPNKIQQTRRCVNFPNKAQADAYATDLQNMGLIPFKGPGTCDDATGFTCKSCDDPGPCNTTTTTAGPLGACCSRLLTEPTFNCQDNVAASQCPPPGIFDMEYIHHPGVSCSSNPCPTTTTTQGPTTTTTQGPTTTSTQGPTTTSTQGPTTTSTQGPTTTTTPAPALGCCRDCAGDCEGIGIFYDNVTEEFCDGIGGTFSSDCFITSLLAPCCTHPDCPPCVTTGPPGPGGPVGL